MIHPVLGIITMDGTMLLYIDGKKTGRPNRAAGPRW